MIRASMVDLGPSSRGYLGGYASLAPEVRFLKAVRATICVSQHHHNRSGFRSKPPTGCSATKG
jgi:hypothetical protein